MPQRKWTIEILADFNDQEKNDVITKIVKEQAAGALAYCGLLADGVKPQVVAYSDDFFGNHEDISVLANDLVASNRLEPSGELLEAINAAKG